MGAGVGGLLCCWSNYFKRLTTRGQQQAKADGLQQLVWKVVVQATGACLTALLMLRTMKSND